jgi:uncharacterized membrane protein
MADAATLTLDRVLAPPPSPAALTGGPAVSPSGTSRRVLGAAAAIVIAGTVIRFAALSTSLWFDESVTVKDVNGSFAQMLHRVVNHEASPPFYFVCLWIWRQLVGDTAVDLRALSALAGSITIVLAFSVARRSIGARAGLILAALVAISPALVYYSTEMRMYGVLVLIAGIGFDAFLRASTSPNRRNLAVWVVASILALWTQYYAALAVVPQAAWLIWLAYKHRSRARATLIAAAAVALAGLPLIYLMIYQAHRAFAYGTLLLSSAWQGQQLSIHTDPTLTGIAGQLVDGPGGPARGLLTLVVVLMLVIALALVLCRRLATGRQLTMAICLIAPAVLVVETLVELHLAVEGRYLLPLWLPVGLGAGFILASVGRLGLLIAGVLVCAWAAAGLVSGSVARFATQDDTFGAARSLGVATTDRLIAISQPWDVSTFEEYRPDTTAATHAVERVRELDVIAMPVGGEPPVSEHQRPSSLGIGPVPRPLRLAQVIRGPGFLVERFVASSPASIRIDGHGQAFASATWRFLREPTGGRMGGL